MMLISQQYQEYGKNTNIFQRMIIYRILFVIYWMQKIHLDYMIRYATSYIPKPCLNTFPTYQSFKVLWNGHVMLVLLAIYGIDFALSFSAMSNCKLRKYLKISPTRIHGI